MGKNKNKKKPQPPTAAKQAENSRGTDLAEDLNDILLDDIEVNMDNIRDTLVRDNVIFCDKVEEEESTENRFVDITDDTTENRFEEITEDDIPDELPDIDSVPNTSNFEPIKKEKDKKDKKNKPHQPQKPAKKEEKEASSPVSAEASSASAAAASARASLSSNAVSSLPTGDCIICEKLAKSFCSGCKHVFYCDKEHQRKHWKSHKEECKAMAALPYRIQRSPTMGRFLVANKDMKEGELVFTEPPMVVGPRQLTKPVCLGCHKEIGSAKECIKCARCNWPVCSVACQDSLTHDAECRATQAAGSKIKVDVFGQTNMMYSCITILRALALREGPSQIWEDYKKFDSHLNERIKTTIYNKVNKEKVVYFIHRYLDIQKYSDLEILEACGKLDTNCFEVRHKGMNLRAMYRLGSIMSHNCTPNTRHTFEPDNSINVFATRAINKGEIISATYTNTLWSTIDRREHLKMSKCFWCSCERCSDPTEFGTFMSSMQCDRCAGWQDHIQMNDQQYLISTNPLENDSLFKCTKCTNTAKADQVKSTSMKITTELKEMDRSNPINLSAFLTKYQRLLAPNNHHMVEVKFALVSLLGNRPNYQLDEISLDLLKLKHRYAEELLEVADKLEPGWTQWRGMLLMELQAAKVNLAHRLMEDGTIERSEAKEKMLGALENVKEAAGILGVEPDHKEMVTKRMQELAKIMEDWED